MSMIFVLHADVSECPRTTFLNDVSVAERLSIQFLIGINRVKWPSFFLILLSYFATDPQEQRLWYRYIQRQARCRCTDSANSSPSDHKGREKKSNKLNRASSIRNDFFPNKSHQHFNNNFGSDRQVSRASVAICLFDVFVFLAATILGATFDSNPNRPRRQPSDATESFPSRLSLIGFDLGCSVVELVKGNRQSQRLRRSASKVYRCTDGG